MIWPFQWWSVEICQTSWFFLLVLLKYGYACHCTLGSQGIRKVLMHQKRNAEHRSWLGIYFTPLQHWNSLRSKKDSMHQKSNAEHRSCIAFEGKGLKNTILILQLRTQASSLKTITPFKISPKFHFLNLKLPHLSLILNLIWVMGFSKI